MHICHRLDRFCAGYYRLLLFIIDLEYILLQHFNKILDCEHYSNKINLLRIIQSID